VVAANHTLVLNWNAQTVPLLRQIAINRAERGEGVYSGCARWQARRRLAARVTCHELQPTQGQCSKRACLRERANGTNPAPHCDVVLAFDLG
jgi:hypothetical protein